MDRFTAPDFAPSGEEHPDTLVASSAVRYILPTDMAAKAKLLRLEQTKIDRARRILQTKTERETVERALDLVLAEDVIVRSHRRVKATGGFRDIFGSA